MKERFGSNQTHSHSPRYLRKSVFDKERDHQGNAVFQQAKEDKYLTSSVKDRTEKELNKNKSISYVATTQFKSSRYCLPNNWTQKANKPLSPKHILERKPETIVVDRTLIPVFTESDGLIRLTPATLLTEKINMPSTPLREFEVNDHFKH